jgi:hypothetical protein
VKGCEAGILPLLFVTLKELPDDANGVGVLGDACFFQPVLPLPEGVIPLFHFVRYSIL